MVEGRREEEEKEVKEHGTAEQRNRDRENGMRHEGGGIYSAIAIQRKKNKKKTRVGCFVVAAAVAVVGLIQLCSFCQD